MPVARIVTRHRIHESEALNGLSEQLRAAGYEVEMAQPGGDGSAADLVVEFDELAADEALAVAAGLARESTADLYIAPGLFEAQPAPQELPQRPLQPAREPAQMPAAPRRAEDGDRKIERAGMIGETLEDVGEALADGKAGIGETVGRVRSRLAEGWAQLQKRRAPATHQLRLDRERRELEHEERRRQHELERQRRAEEKQQLIAERERSDREAMALEAARRAEIAYAEDEERRRRAALEADRLLALREQEGQRVAALEAERLRLQREEEARRAAALAATARQGPPALPAQPRGAPGVNPARAFAGMNSGATQSSGAGQPPVVAEPVLADAAPAPRLRAVRQWQRAALIALMATLAAMIGFAMAGNMHPRPPLPASLIQNGAQQQVPFGPAKMDVSSAGRPTKVAPSLSHPNLANPGRDVARPTSGATALRKPSAAKPAPKRRAKRAGRDSDVVTEDEVVVRHFASPRIQRARSTTGVKHYSDEN